MNTYVCSCTINSAIPSQFIHPVTTPGNAVTMLQTTNKKLVLCKWRVFGLPCQQPADLAAGGPRFPIVLIPPVISPNIKLDGRDPLTLKIDCCGLLWSRYGRRDVETPATIAVLGKCHLDLETSFAHIDLLLNMSFP